MKYIAYLNVRANRCPDIRLFSDMEKHRHIAAEMEVLSANLLGAGFVQFKDNGSAECYGHSESLDLKSRGDKDTNILRRTIKLSKRRR